MWTRTLAKPMRRLNFPKDAAPAARPRLAVTDAARTPDPAAMAERLPPGTVVLFRHYDAPDRRALGARLARVCRRRRLYLLVAGDARLAAALGADGLHLPEYLARRGPPPVARLWLRRRGAVLTAACHSPAALARAAALGADLALLSPVFPTRSHPGAATLGPVRFALWAGRAGLPVAALGGVTAATARRLPQAAALAGVPPSATRLP